MEAEVFQYFASDPLGPIFRFPEVLDIPDLTIAEALERHLNSYPDDLVEVTKADQHFLFFHGNEGPGHLERSARAWLLMQELAEEIPKRRLAVLARQNAMSRPPPYDHPVLADVDIDEHRLVELGEFEIRGGAAVKAGFAFGILPPVESPNSQWWFIQQIARQGLAHDTRVRLDPFQYRPLEQFAGLEYKMWWYGRPLDWSRIRALHEEEHGRWHPGRLTRHQGIRVTDFVWTPRNGEVHFRCEELPTTESARTRGSRYVHAILRRHDDAVSHLDGAIRIYTGAELEARAELHVRRAGKSGTRVKVFQIDSVLSTEVLSALVPSFFVWNYDVARYFGAQLPEDI